MSMIYLKNVVTLEVDREKCTGCGVCLEVCPHEVLELREKRVRIRNRDACMECGACSRNCPAGAVSVEAGVGCAAAVINGLLYRQSASCGCSVDPKNASAGKVKGTCCS
ncbi:MAG TPA: mercury methylation ferredoxin HgcB [Syntrophales bacterium]|nr:mercury methylation ferredoxin HgcB [Syntrophales bacterium]